MTTTAHKPQSLNPGLGTEAGEFDWAAALTCLSALYPYNQRGGVKQLAADLGVEYDTLAKWRARSADSRKGSAPLLKHQEAIAALYQSKCGHVLTEADGQPEP